MSIRRIEAGPRMSQAVVHGDIVYLAGQVGRPGGSVSDQTRDVLASIDRLLGEAGSEKSKSSRQSSGWPTWTISRR